MLENTSKISTNRLVERIVQACRIPNHNGTMGLPGIIYGRAGGGKSSAFFQAADILTAQDGVEWQVVDVRAMLYDPTEFGGIRTIDPEGGAYALSLNPDWTRGLDLDSRIIIVFEEATKAPIATQNALYQSILDRRSGQFVWGRHWVPFMTGNLQSSRAGDLPVPGPLRNRAWAVICENTANDWLHWAEANAVHPYVQTFVKANPDHWLSWNPETNPLVFSSERSLTMFSDVCKVVDDPKPWAVALLGQETGELMRAHIDLCASMVDIDDIRNDPHNAAVCDDVAVALYVANMVAYWAKPEDMEAITTYARRCPHEVAKTMVDETVRRHPECKTTQAYIAFQCEYDPNQ